MEEDKELLRIVVRRPRPWAEIVLHEDHPNVFVNPDEEPRVCTICHEDLRAREHRWAICGCAFHTDCLHTWFGKQKEGHTCPVCRTEISERRQGEYLREIGFIVDHDAVDVDAPKYTSSGRPVLPPNRFEPTYKRSYAYLAPWGTFRGEV